MFYESLFYLPWKYLNYAYFLLFIINVCLKVYDFFGIYSVACVFYKAWIRYTCCQRTSTRSFVNNIMSFLRYLHHRSKKELSFKPPMTNLIGLFLSWWKILLRGTQFSIIRKMRSLVQIFGCFIQTVFIDISEALKGFHYTRTWYYKGVGKNHYTLSMPFKTYLKISRWYWT